MSDRCSQYRGDQALHDRARKRDTADGEQFFDVKLESDAEHEKDDANLGELLRHRSIGDESGCMRSDECPGEKVADDRRQAEALRDIPENQGRGEPAGQRVDQIEVVHWEMVPGANGLARWPTNR